MTDRLEQCKQRLQWKLESAIEHVASISMRIKSAPPHSVQRVCIEMQELQQEITDLRNALHYIADFEVEELSDSTPAN